MATAVLRRAVALACLAVAAAARADGVQTIERIEVTGHYDNAIGTSDAASQGTITRALIEDRPLLRPGEVLELVPGMIITQHSGAGKANQYFLRGFNLDHGTDFLTRVAGMPVNMRSHAHGQGYTDLNFLIPELIARIDYAKGPYFAQYGDFANAGAADIHYVESLPGGFGEASIGEHGYRRALATGGWKAGGGDLVAGVEVLANDGPWTHPDDFRKWNGVLRYTWTGDGAKAGVTAMAYRGKWNATDQIPLRAVEDGRLGRWDTVDPTSGGESDRYSISADAEAKLGGGLLQANAYFVRSTLDLYSNFTYFLDRPDDGDQFLQSERRRMAGGQATWTRFDQVGGFDMRNTVGAEFRADRLRPVGLYTSIARGRTGTTREDRVDETSGGLWIENGTRWTDWLRTVAGLRYDRYRFEVDSNLPANSGRDTDGRFSPKFSAIVGPWARTELFANVGDGFHSNDARGVTTTVDPNTGEAVDPVTPLVRARGYELGARTEFLPGVQSSLAMWRLDIDSELLFIGDAGTTEASRPSRRTGVEWSTRWTPKPWLLFDLDVAYTRARFRDDDPVGRFIPGALETAVAAGATVRDYGPWSGSVFLRYFGARPLTEDDAVKSGSSTIVNASLGYRIDDTFRVTLDAFNLFDRRVDDITYFYASRLPGEPAEGIEDKHFHPAEKRSLRVALQARF